MKTLIIEDEKITRISITNTLNKEGFEATSVENYLSAITLIKTNIFDVVITDLRLPDGSGINILKEVLNKNPNTKVIVVTAYGTVENAVEALKMGAYDYLTKPYAPEKIISMLKNLKTLKELYNENIELKNRLNSIYQNKIVGTSKFTINLIESINHIATNDFTVLIKGESGTGKELVARTLHQLSNRKNEPFITVSCSSIPESLYESELFGYERGAFTGANKMHAGYFERADKGTIFLDDIDDFPQTMQIKLLRVLQEKEIIRVGGRETIKIDFRLICASKVDLFTKVKNKEFREDLYYRLNIIPLNLLPLRERKEDIIPLLQYFFQKHNAKEKINLITQEIFNYLLEYDWFGNIRELENIVLRIIALSYMNKIDKNMLNLQNKERRDAESENIFNNFDLEEYLSNKEYEIIVQALSQTKNNISAAAKLIGIPRTTLNNKIERLKINL